MKLMRTLWPLPLLLFGTALFVGISLAATTAEGQKWLKTNKKMDGVIETKSGLQYKIVKSGPPEGVSPGLDSVCTVHYRGSLIDGTVFDSSFDRGKPTDFIPSQVVPGMREALQLMKPGDEWEVFLPSELGYGDSKVGKDIKPGAVLVFSLQLIKVSEPPPRSTKTTVALAVGGVAGCLLLLVAWKNRTGVKGWFSRNAVKPAKKAVRKGKAEMSERKTKSKGKGKAAGKYHPMHDSDKDSDHAQNCETHDDAAEAGDRQFRV